MLLRETQTHTHIQQWNWHRTKELNDVDWRMKKNDDDDDARRNYGNRLYTSKSEGEAEYNNKWKRMFFFLLLIRLLSHSKFWILNSLHKYRSHGNYSQSTMYIFVYEHTKSLAHSHSHHIFGWMHSSGLKRASHHK